MNTPRQTASRRTPPYFAAVGLVAVALAVVGTLVTSPDQAHATTPTARPTFVSSVVA